MTFSSKFLAWPTRMPAVWAIASMQRHSGITGKAGEVVVQMLFGEGDVLDGNGLLPLSNSTNLSIHIHRIVFLTQLPAGRLTGQFAFHIIDD